MPHPSCQSPYSLTRVFPDAAERRSSLGVAWEDELHCYTGAANTRLQATLPTTMHPMPSHSRAMLPSA
jgi:hypothetical protein